MTETEIKIACSPPQARAWIQLLGAREEHPRAHEWNVLYDTAGGTLQSSHRLLRLRRYGTEVLLTVKAPVPQEEADSRFKTRREWETRLDSWAVGEGLLAALGYTPWLRYEKYRTILRVGEDLHLMLDETPAGLFLELEGSRPAILQAAQTLGVIPDAFITANYLTLYRQRGGEGDMVFP